MTDTTTDQPAATDLAAVVDGYLSAWNERDEARRGELVARFWADDAVLADPPLSGEGHAGISEMAATLHGMYPEHRFVRTSGIDAHHGFLRFAWSLVDGEGDAALSGMDVGVVGPDGRMQRVVGFFGDLPAAGA